jgi:hypothetical protein
MSGAKTSRRRILAGSAGALLASGGLVAAAGLQGAQEASPDAELIWLCNEFCNLQRSVLNFFPGGVAAIDCDDARCDAIAPLEERQGELLASILDIRAVTPEGFSARAQMVYLYAQDLLNPANITGWDDAMLAALVRDMVGAPEP